MARTGITQNEVFQVANELYSSGVKPTIEQIRSVLKTGSNTTIALHLRRWHSLQTVDSLPDSGIKFPREMIEVLNKAWDDLSERAKSCIDELKQQHEVAINDLEDQLQKYKINNKRWQDMLTKWQEDKNQLIDEKNQLQNELREQKINNQNQIVELETEKTKNQELIARISELNRLFKQAQENLEHFRESSRIQREDEQNKFANEKQLLSIEIKNLQAALLDLNAKKSVVSNENKALLAEMADLKNEVEENNKKIKESREHLRNIETQNSILENQVADLKNRNEEYKKSNQTDTKLLIDKESEIKALKSQLNYLETELSESKKQATALEKEKWMRKMVKNEILHET